MSNYSDFFLGQDNRQYIEGIYNLTSIKLLIFFLMISLYTTQGNMYSLKTLRTVDWKPLKTSCSSLPEREVI